MVQACGNYETETEDISEVITTTEVSYYDHHILLCHYCNYSSIAKNLIQGATEVTIILKS